MENEGSNETTNDALSEPIETSVISIDTEMIIVQPPEMDQAENDASQNRNEPQADVEVDNSIVESSTEAESTPSPKRRKRIPPLNNDDDDGSTCSICLDTWEIQGDHRLVSLKCGHLFGDSCIKRWINECPTQSKCCPTCKKKAKLQEFRTLYAKRVVVVDKSEEYRLQDLLELEKTKNVDLQSKLSAKNLELAVLKDEYTKLKGEYNDLLKCGKGHGPMQASSHRDNMYKMSLHKNIDISREGGCKAMTYGKRIQTLIVSQKLTTRLFPGFGVRFVSGYDLQRTVEFRISAKAIRDLSLDSDEELLAVAALESTAYVYSVTNHTSVATLSPSESNVWATSFDKIRPKYLHLGTQQGITYTYDIRNPTAYVDQLTTAGDMSPVIEIHSVPASNEFRFGGVIVCKLQSVWFYEYTASQQIEQTKLTVEGPFVSINYDEQTNVLLIATRIGTKHPQGRLIVGNLTKIDQTTVFRPICQIMGSRAHFGTRSTQINVGNDSIVASYLKDSKAIGIWNSKNGTKMQGFGIDTEILGMCPMYMNNNPFLATLSEQKCRIFQLNSV